jgi:ATP-dependent DNA helicase PIF1
VDQLQDAFDDDSDKSRKIINSITRYSASLLGTRPYWSGQSKVLEPMVQQLGCPNLFVTLSAADMHWDSLMELFPDYEEWLIASREERMRMARKNIRDSPHIIAYHFYRCLQVFQDHVLVPKFNVKDYWHRFEWQARGSTHNHGLWWSEGTPDVNNIAISQEARDNFAKFWGIHITAFNPEPDSGACPAAEDSMIQTPGLELMNNGITLSSGLNRVQGHLCSKSYCLRMNKTTRVEECRFGLPAEKINEAVVTKHQNHSYMHFYPARNNEYLNKYNRLITMA